MHAQKGWLFLLLSVVALGSFLEVGSYESHLANAIGDDHPAIWSKIYSKPDFNKKSISYQGAAGFIYSSLPNLLTALAGRVHSQASHWLCYFFLTIQTLGLAFSLFYFCRVFVPDDTRALLTATVTYLIHPWTFNLGYYPNLIFTPYPGQLVLPFLVLSFAFALKENWKFWIISLSIAGLIHPTLTLQATTVCALFFLLTKIKLKNGYSILGFFIPILFSVILPLFFVPQPINLASREEILQSIFTNPHLNPVKNQILWPWAVPSVLGIFLLSYLPVHFRTPSTDKKVKALWLSCFISLSGFIIFHLLSLKLEFIRGILLSGFRSSSLTSLILLPFGVYFLLNTIENRQKSQSPEWLWSYWILGFLIISQRGLPWPGIIALFVLLRFPQSKRAVRFTQILFGFWWLFFFMSLRPLRNWGLGDLASDLQYLIAPAFSFQRAEYLIWFFSFVLLFLVPRRVHRHSIGLASIFLLILGLWNCFETGAISKDEYRSALVQAQKWAYKTTLPQSRFLTTLWSWRGISDRDATMVLGKPSGGSGNPYFRFSPDRALRSKLQKVFEEAQAKNIGELNEQEIRNISSLTNTDYFVVDKSKVDSSWEFSICFENSHFKIYDLKNDSCLSI